MRARARHAIPRDVRAHRVPHPPKSLSQGLEDARAQFVAEGSCEEEELFALRALLILMSLDDVATARDYWNKIAAPQDAATVAAALQCGSLLLAAAELRSLELWRCARTASAHVLRRDDSFERYLEEIEARIFGAAAPCTGLGALFKAFFSGGDAGDGDVVSEQDAGAGGM
eukprot:NODE_18099_length_910_cov_6.893997.p1 GENE.NODE_18099_length_910_cov_6.893997~~NODE_18099_length_910_cov_6.893997.p1  ORF type:complete len:171 (+),score=54.99 NODE_18099_length_910_cov_6.893997:333-845(+)